MANSSEAIYYSASMVKWTKTVFQNLILLVKGLEVVAECCYNWGYFFQDDLYCCVKYSNVEYQVEIFKILIIKSGAQKQRVEYEFTLSCYWLVCFLNVYDFFLHKIQS